MRRKDIADAVGAERRWEDLGTQAEAWGSEE
jgi:hypothetical protein